MGEDRGVHRVLVGKPEGKRPLGRPRCRWEDNIKMDFQEAHICWSQGSRFKIACLDPLVLLWCTVLCHIL